MIKMTTMQSVMAVKLPKLTKKRATFWQLYYLLFLFLAARYEISGYAFIWHTSKILSLYEQLDGFLWKTLKSAKAHPFRCHVCWSGLISKPTWYFTFSFSPKKHLRKPLQILTKLVFLSDWHFSPEKFHLGRRCNKIYLNYRKPKNSAYTVEQTKKQTQPHLWPKLSQK